MEKLKIYLGKKDRDLKTEILDCLATLGYTWTGEKDYLDRATPEAIYTSVYVDGDIALEHSIAYSMFYHLSPEHRVVTIEKLRDMVVLHRNDEDDATHAAPNTLNTIAVKLSDDWYFYNYSHSCWDKASNHDHLKGLISTLKPIQKAQPQVAEYAEFLKKLEDGTYILQTVPKHAGDDEASGLIPVPEGAEVFMTGFHGGYSAFYKDNFTRGFTPKTDSVWWGCCSSLDYLQSNGGRIVWERNPSEPDPFLKEYLTPDYKLMLASGPQDGWIEVPDGSVHAIKLVKTIEAFVGTIVFMNAAGLIFVHGKTQEFTNGTYDTVEGYVDDGDLLIWSRHPQPEPETATLEDSDNLLDVVYHYSASFNSARGSVSYDGVITFPGRITGIEDYRKVRAEIAKNGNVTPDQVNVHSLTIVG